MWHRRSCRWWLQPPVCRAPVGLAAPPDSLRWPAAGARGGVRAGVLDRRGAGAGCASHSGRSWMHGAGNPRVGGPAGVARGNMAPVETEAASGGKRMKSFSGRLQNTLGWSVQNTLGWSVQNTLGPVCTEHARGGSVQNTLGPVCTNTLRPVSDVLSGFRTSVCSGPLYAQPPGTPTKPTTLVCPKIGADATEHRPGINA